MSFTVSYSSKWFLVFLLGMLVADRWLQPSAAYMLGALLSFGLGTALYQEEI